MKKWLLVTFAAMLLFSLSACGGGNGTGTSSTLSAPAIAKVKIWVTLSNNPDAAPVTSLTSAQTVQASIWARGTTENSLVFKVNLCYNDKFTTLATGVRTENSSKAVSVGALSTPLQPGSYTFQAISGAFGEIVGSSQQITVTPDTSVNTPTVTPSSPVSPSTAPPAPTLSGQPDKATFQKYFSDMGLGRLPVNAKSPLELQRNVATFAAGDPLTLYGTAIQEVQISAQYYNVATKQSFDAPAPPTPMKVGGFSGSTILTLPAGKYEYKVYVANVLVAVFPFEVLAAPSSQPTPQPSPTLSEQPDKATFQKYFSAMGLGKIPRGGQMPLDFQQNATVFTQGDQIGIYLNVIHEVQVRTAIYDVAAKKVVKEGGLPGSLPPKNYAGADPLTIPVGKYEYKVYANDVLVAVFPFEVVADPSSQPTPQPSPTSSEQPDKTTYDNYFLNQPAPMGIGKLTGTVPQELQQNVTVFAIGDQIVLYGNIIKECQQPRYAIHDVQAKKVIKEGALSFPPMKSGFDAVGFVSIDTLDIPVGKYEYKVYVSDVFVAVFPFEVR